MTLTMKVFVVEGLTLPRVVRVVYAKQRGDNSVEKLDRISLIGYRVIRSDYVDNQTYQ